MRRLLLTLLAAAVAAPQELRRTNPWLSACDVSADPPPAAAGELCALGPAERARALAARLPHCRERALAEALDPEQRAQVLAGGPHCEDIVGALYSVDDMASRASRDLASILARYDCAQPFSVIHSCEDCQEAYRRWVCSSLLPLFVSGAALGARGGRVPGEDSPARDGRPPAPPPRKRSTSRDNYKLYASNNKNTKLKNDYLNYELGDKDASGADYFETFYYSASRNVSRSGLHNASAGSLWGEGFVTGRPWNEKVHGRPEHRVVGTKKDLDNRLGARRRRATTAASAALNFRVKPCLAVCQRVEQACPYFLPGDRAPSYPTQYAGEPTFLCLDPNIEETGEQLRKSNYGDTDCCYTHCGPSGEELCSRCHHGATLPAQDQPHSAPCGSQVPAQAPSTQCGSQTIVSPAQTSSTRRTTPDPVVIIIFAWFPFLYSAYNNIVLSPRRKDARYSLTFIVLSRIMRIVWCTRL